MRYAWDALRRRPGRSAASALGIALATALIVALLSASDAIDESADRLAVASGVDLLATSANTSLLSGSFPAIDGAHALPSAIVRADPNVETASPWLLGSLTFANGSLRNATASGAVPAGWSPTDSGSVGWIPGLAPGLDLPPILSGPGYPTLSDPLYDNGTYRGTATNAVVLDSQLAALLGVVPGDPVWVSPAAPSGPTALAEWFAGARELHVVGISGPYWLVPSALLAFLYLSEMQTLVGPGAGGGDPASLVLIHLVDPTRAATDQRQLASRFPGLSFFTLTDILTQVQDAISLYRTFGTLVGLAGLAVAILFATTVLLLSVEDRSRELALLRALGFGRATVVRYVVEESFLLGAFGLLGGLGLGWAAATGLNLVLLRLVNGLPAGFSFIAFDGTVIVTAAIEVALVAALASLLPAVRAGRIPIALELRSP